jgi:hypothetical protein
MTQVTTTLRRRVLRTALGLALILGLAACGAANAATPSTEVEVAAPSTSTTTEATTTTTQPTTTTTRPTPTTTVVTTTAAEDLFIKFLVTASYDKGGTLEGMPIATVSESDLIDVGRMWCEIAIGLGPNVSLANPVKSQAMSIATESRDEPSKEVMITLFVAAEAFLCNDELDG